jgi:hypothetical protein
MKKVRVYLSNKPNPPIDLQIQLIDDVTSDDSAVTLSESLAGLSFSKP